jgi:hypothetical protein
LPFSKRQAEATTGKTDKLNKMIFHLFPKKQTDFGTTRLFQSFTRKQNGLWDEKKQLHHGFAPKNGDRTQTAPRKQNPKQTKTPAHPTTTV